MISPTDPAARYTASANSVAGYAYSANYLIDLTRRDASDLGLAAVDEETSRRWRPAPGCWRA